MSIEEQLRAEDWGRISAKLTASAWKILHKRHRTWELAQDLAQDAIAQAFERKNGWDPQKIKLMAYLCRLVWMLATGYRRRVHNTYEVTISDEEREAVPTAGDTHDTTIARRQITNALEAGMLERLKPDRVGTILLTLFVEGIDAAADQAAATALPIEEIRRARRRVFDHAEVVARELGMEEVTL